MSGAPPDLFVFAYGSLMWRPGFEFADVKPARLSGWHRRLCITSRHHRGTHARPGLVLGLDRGGVTDGLIYRVPAAEAVAVRQYLRAREQISGIYREALVRVSLRDGSGDHCHALTYLAEQDHPGFAHRAPVHRQAQIIAGAKGLSGSNVEYLINTLSELQRLGIRERELERVRTCLGAIRGTRGIKLQSHTRVFGWPQQPALRAHDVNRFAHRAHCR